MNETRGRLVLVAGTDPMEAVSGHRTLVAAHARAAAAAGFAPHVFCIGPPPRIEHSELGTLHRIASPIRRRYTLLAAVHEPVLVAAISRHLAGAPGPHVIHSFGAWASTGVDATRTSPAGASMRSRLRVCTRPLITSRRQRWAASRHPTASGRLSGTGPRIGGCGRWRRRRSGVDTAARPGSWSTTTPFAGSSRQRAGLGSTSGDCPTRPHSHSGPTPVNRTRYRRRSASCDLRVRR